MPDVLIRGVPKNVLDEAKKLAVKRSRSLQEELLSAVVESVTFNAGAWATRADAIRSIIEKRGGKHTDSAKLIREDRDR